MTSGDAYDVFMSYARRSDAAVLNGWLEAEGGGGGG
jgi:hypothetical protein